jgi:helix-turn-helix protein
MKVTTRTKLVISLKESEVEAFESSLKKTIGAYYDGNVSLSEKEVAFLMVLYSKTIENLEEV